MRDRTSKTLRTPGFRLLAASQDCLAMRSEFTFSVGHYCAKTIPTMKSFDRLFLSSNAVEPVGNEVLQLDFALHASFYQHWNSVSRLPATKCCAQPFAPSYELEGTSTELFACCC